MKYLSLLDAYKKIKNDPTRPMYRNKEMNTPKRRSECRKKNKTWFRKGGQETVLFAQATPNSASQ